MQSLRPTAPPWGFQPKLLKTVKLSKKQPENEVFTDYDLLTKPHALAGKCCVKATPAWPILGGCFNFLTRQSVGLNCSTQQRDTTLFNSLSI